MNSPIELIRKSIGLFASNFIYILKFIFVWFGLMVGALLVLALPLIAISIIIPGVRESGLVILVGSLSASVLLLYILWASSTSLVFYKSIIEGQNLPFGLLLKLGWSLMGKFFVVNLLTLIAVIVGLVLLVIPGLIMMIWFVFVNQIIAFENLGGTQALSRSKSLIKGRFWRTVKYFVVPYGLSILFSLALSFLFMPFDLSSEVESVIINIITFPVGIIFAIYLNLMYKEFVASSVK